MPRKHQVESLRRLSASVDRTSAHGAPHLIMQTFRMPDGDATVARALLERWHEGPYKLWSKPPMTWNCAISFSFYKSNDDTRASVLSHPFPVRLLWTNHVRAWGECGRKKPQTNISISTKVPHWLERPKVVTGKPFHPEMLRWDSIVLWTNCITPTDLTFKCDIKEFT